MKILVIEPILIRLWISCRVEPSEQSNRYVSPPRRKARQEPLRCIVAEPEEVPMKERQNSMFCVSLMSEVRHVRR